MKNTLFATMGCFLVACLPLAAQQKLQIVNDAAPAWGDDDVYLLFTANPASVTANGTTISGVRDASLPIGTVSTPTVADGSKLVSSSFNGHTLPKSTFPIQFLSGNNAVPVGNATTAPVFEVTAYVSGTGEFTVNGTLLPMSSSDQFVVGAYSEKLSMFPKVGNLVSELSGRSQPIYEVTLGNNFAAGVVYVSYGAPLTYTTAAPAPDKTKTLFQIFEVTTAANGSNATTSDLTYIDAYGFPLQIESVTTADNSVSDIRTFYFSANTVASDLDLIGTLTTNATVLRLGPGQFVAANRGNPHPFPSFTEYLDAVHFKSGSQIIAGVQAFGTPNPGTVYGVTVVGNYTQTYSYRAGLTTDGAGNFTYTLVPFGANTITGTVPPYFPPIEDVTSLTVNLPADSLNETIYGCTLTSQSFAVNVSGNRSLVPTTFSGNFAVTSATSNSVVSTDSNLVQLAVDQLGGTWLNFLTGPLASHGPVVINSGTLAGGTATLALNGALPSVPAAGDRFEILFQVDSASNTVSSFSTTQLGSNNLNFITGNITFVECNSLSANNTGRTVAIASVNAAGNLLLQTDLPEAPVAGDIYRISAADSDVQTQLYTNSGFAWVAADVLSALNLGFIDGTAGDSSADWFGQFPQEFPYGLARPKPDDGYYNPWGAYFYNASDGYAFAFSDRIEPSPLLSTDPTTQALRLTILPHDQIDAPLVTATATNSSLSLEWPPQAGVSYVVKTEPELPADGKITVDSGKGTAEVEGLPPGTPFEVSVTGSKPNQTSYTLPQIFSTTGNATAVSGVTKFFQAQFIWSGGATVPLDYHRYTVKLNGRELDFSGDYASATSTPIQVSGKEGNNLYVIDFIDTQSGNRTVMQSVLQLEFSNLTYNATAGGNFTLHNISYNATANAGSLTNQAVLASGGAVHANGVATSHTDATATYHIPPGGLSPLVVAINFTPLAGKQFAPVVLPTPAPTPAPNPTPAPTPTPKGGGSEEVQKSKKSKKSQHSRTSDKKKNRAKKKSAKKHENHHAKKAKKAKKGGGGKRNPKSKNTK